MGLVPVASIGGVTPQVKLRLRKRNKNITLESIDKYNKNKLLKVFSDCYIVMQVLEVYPGEIDDAGEPVDSDEYLHWKNAHPDDIPDNFRNLIYNLIINNIYPKLCYLHSNGYVFLSIISLLSNFFARKSGNATVVDLEYINKNSAGPSSVLQRIEISLNSFDEFQYVRIYNIQSNVVKR